MLSSGQDLLSGKYRMIKLTLLCVVPCTPLPRHFQRTGGVLSRFSFENKWSVKRTFPFRLTACEWRQKATSHISREIRDYNVAEEMRSDRHAFFLCKCTPFHLQWHFMCFKDYIMQKTLITGNSFNDPVHLKTAFLGVLSDAHECEMRGFLIVYLQIPMHSNNISCPQILPLSAPVLFWLSHLTCISNLKARNRWKTLIYTS